MSNLYRGLLETVRRAPDRVAIAIDNHEVTFARLHAHVAGVARWLGDRRSKHVGLLAGNTPGCVAGYFGILAAGGTAVPLNAMLTAAEHVPMLAHAQVDTLLIARELTSAAPAIAQALPELTIQIVDDIAPEATLDPLPYAEHAGENDVAILLYTSGTTGDPKGVMLTHGNFLTNFDSFRRAFSFTEEMVFVTVLPLFHSYAFTVQLLPCVLMGCRLVLCTSFKPKALMAAFLSNSNIVFVAVPPMYALLAATAPADVALANRITYLVSGGGPMPHEVQRTFEEKLGLEVYEGYGLTEASPVVSANCPQFANRRGTIGKPLPGVEVEVWDDRNQPQPIGSEGELMVRGPNVMAGYYRNDKATAEALDPAGWLHTGDLATIDEDGYIRIVGRKKELIVSAGENIHPREVEEVLVQHPAVFEAAVIGVPDKLKTEVPKAFLCPAPGQDTATIDIAQLKAFTRERLAAHKVPVSWEVRESLPKTPTGKVAKRQLQ